MPKQDAHLVIFTGPAPFQAGPARHMQVQGQWGPLGFGFEEQMMETIDIGFREYFGVPRGSL